MCGELISAANLPEELTIKDPFDKDYLRSLPHETLVEIIVRGHAEMKNMMNKYQECICLKIDEKTLIERSF